MEFVDLQKKCPWCRQSIYDNKRYCLQDNSATGIPMNTNDCTEENCPMFYWVNQFRPNTEKGKMKKLLKKLKKLSPRDHFHYYETDCFIGYNICKKEIISFLEQELSSE